MDEVGARCLDIGFGRQCRFDSRRPRAGRLANAKESNECSEDEDADRFVQKKRAKSVQKNSAREARKNFSVKSARKNSAREAHGKIRR